MFAYMYTYIYTYIYKYIHTYIDIQRVRTAEQSYAVCLFFLVEFFSACSICLKELFH